MKIRLVRAELFLADVRTDMTKLIVAFRNFANALKKLLGLRFEPFSCQIYRIAIGSTTSVANARS
jgi:hypothetical protein